MRMYLMMPFIFILLVVGIFTVDAKAAISTILILNESNGGNVGDTYVRGDVANQNTNLNYPNDTNFYVGGGSPGDWFKSLLLWNITAIPSDIIITNAIMSVYEVETTNHGFNIYAMNGTNSNWTENNVTWSNMPAESTLQDTQPTFPPKGGEWIYFNITNAVLSQYPQSMKNITIILGNSTSTSQNARFLPKEYTTNVSRRPQLTITYIENIPKNGTSINLYLNGTQGNITCGYSCQLNATAKINTSDLPVNLYKDGILISSNNTLTFNITIWPAGTYNMTAAYEGNDTYAASNVTYYVTITKYPNMETLTSSAGWNILYGTSTTATCSVTNSTAVLTNDGIIVSNPYTASLIGGSYAFSCYGADTQNYTGTASNTLNVIATSVGCVNTTNYVYAATLPFSLNQTTIDFTTLYTQRIVKSDLSDVYLMTSNASASVSLNATAKYFMVNSSNVTSFTVYFGNSLANNSYSNSTPINETIATFNYTQLSTYYYTANILDEINGSLIYPLPNTSTVIIKTYCSAGESTFNATGGTMIFPTEVQLTSARLTATYSSSSLYYRDLVVTTGTGFLNFYVLDATQYSMVQDVMTLIDNTGLFSNSTLKIQKLLGGSTVTITELPFDIEKKAIVFLQNSGTYSIQVYTSTATRGMGNMIIDNVNLAKNIVINPVINTPNYNNNVTWNVSMHNTTGIVTFNWYAPAGTTTYVNLSIYNYSAGVLTILAQQNWTTDSILYTYAGSTADTYYYVINVKNSLMSNHDTTIAGYIFAGLANLIGFIYPAFPVLSPTVYLWGSFILITSIPMFFDGARGTLGGLMVALAGIALIAFHWWGANWAMAAIVASIALFLAIMNILGHKRRMGEV